MKMFRSTVIILGVVGACLAGVTKREADADPGYGKHNNLQCFSKPHKQCHQKPIQNKRQECHEEYDVIVDTTYIEQCQDIITEHCNSVSQQVHQSSAVVGPDSQVVSHGHGYGKREAEAKAEADAEPGYGHSSGPQCQQKVDRQCHKVPKQNQRKVPRQVCHEEYDTIVDTTYIEECQDIVTQHCNSVSQQVSHSSAVVGHDSQVVSHGHGYGKREAEAKAEPGFGGYSSGPQCHQKKDRQCHKVPKQNQRKVARPVCKTIVDTTYIEECEETFTTECQQSHTQVHHSSAVVGHDSQVIKGGYH